MRGLQSATGFVALVLVLWAARAQAQCRSCETDTDCGHGYVCHKDDAGFLTCMLDLCDTDADCPPDVRCVHPTEPRCAAPSQCTPDADRGQCLPPWAAPCRSDADCGPEYACKEILQCGCWWADETPDEPCGCRGSGSFRCESVPSTCEIDSTDVCPSGWWCQTYSPVRNVCYQPWERDGGSCDVIEGPEVRRCEPPCLGLPVENYREFSIPTDDHESLGSPADGGSGGGSGGTGAPVPSSGATMDASVSSDGGMSRAHPSSDCGCSVPGSRRARASGPLILLMWLLAWSTQATRVRTRVRGGSRRGGRGACATSTGR